MSGLNRLLGVSQATKAFYQAEWTPADSKVFSTHTHTHRQAYINGSLYIRLLLFPGHPNMGGPMQRMTPPRGMVPLGPQVCDWLRSMGPSLRPLQSQICDPVFVRISLAVGCDGRVWFLCRATEEACAPP